MDSRDLRISVRTRTEINYFAPLFRTDIPVPEYYRQAADIAYRFNSTNTEKKKHLYISAAHLNACAILHYLYQHIITEYITHTNTDFFSRIESLVGKNYDCQEVIAFFAKEFPSPLLSEQVPNIDYFTEETIRGFFIHQVLATNPAIVKAIAPFITPDNVVFPQATKALSALMGGYLKNNPTVGGTDEDLFSFLTRPARLHPDSLIEQLQYILSAWKDFIPKEIERLLLNAIDFAKEEEKPRGFGNTPGKPETYVPDYSRSMDEYEAFSEDRNWMPNVVMIAKSTLVWLDQLSKFYGCSITRLDQIPDKELDFLQERGFTALWLIGLWERSDASKRIKQLCGNPDAEASAYSLKNEEIAPAIGGWEALENLRQRCAERGIKLASDMVPNHTGIDSDWVMYHPEYFLQQSFPPFPSYTYNGPDLSSNPDIEIKIEDHYYDQSDAAVTFRRIDKRTGETRYIFHGNDGTSMPWNDTAQLDFLNPVTREAVYQQIRHVAQNFHIIRFDAAMTLAKKHIQRLWYPKPGHGGDIAGRASYSLTDREFDARIPKEFWREVVDRMAQELPDTLLLAEAFWMMEGYFVRTLGMHRVYNSAFMNMLKNQENRKYREAIKATISFEPEILKRYVNFMSNPDEETAIGQFGDGDKYFGVCTLLATMPGLPMFGHGQIEGFHEKYGMEYRRAYWDEWPNQQLVEGHEKKIFPLLKKRSLYSGVAHFQLYDLCNGSNIQESAFCYSNSYGKEKSLVLYNNQYEQVEGFIRTSAPKLDKTTGQKKTTSLAEALGLTVSGKRFLICKNFSDGLYYIVPSLRLFEEGLWVHLNGYESRVYMQIKEVEDVDGNYEKICNMLEGKGIDDMENAVRLLRLEPLFSTMTSLRNHHTLDTLTALLKSKSTKAMNRKLIIQLAEMYAKLPLVYENMPSTAKELLPGPPAEIIPAKMLGTLTKFASLFTDNPILCNLVTIMDELPLVMAGALFLTPFVNDKMSLEELLEANDKMLTDHFFENQLEEIGCKGDQTRRICHGSAVFLIAYRYMGTNPKKALQLLLQHQGALDFAMCNTYQGTVWYNKEAMQELIILSALSAGLFPDTDFPFMEYLEQNLEKESTSEYKVDKLIN